MLSIVYYSRIYAAGKNPFILDLKPGPKIFQVKPGLNIQPPGVKLKLKSHQKLKKLVNRRVAASKSLAIDQH